MAADSITFAVKRARAAQQRWRALALRRRVAVIGRLRGLIAADPQALVDAVGDCYGRTPAQTLSAEIIPLADACRFVQREAARVLAPQRLGLRGRPLWLWGVHGEVRREPVGVVLILAPGNYRLLLAGVQIVQALAAGNAVLVKPAPGARAPLALLAHLLVRAGLPADLVCVLDADKATGQAALGAGVDRVVLTGSAATGRAVAAALAAKLVPATLELSGDDAVFVLADADLDLVADSVLWGMTLNAGATCIAPRRIYVARAAHTQLERRLAARLAGHPPLAVDNSVKRRAQDTIGAALAAGYRRIGRPSDTHGDALFPLLLVHDGPDPAPLPGDLFAPVATLIAVGDMTEALAHDARGAYALGAAVFGNRRDARVLAGRIDAGVVTVNDLIVPTADPRVAFGGRQASGYGATRGAAGLLEMTVPKSVLYRRGRARPHIQPETARDRDLFAAFLRATHGRGWGARLRACAALVAALMRRQ